MVGVLTKLDIMDRGTDASAILRNEVVPLRLGYIGMVNRSQADINSRRSIRDAAAAEAAFFESRPEYQEVQLNCQSCSAASGLDACACLS
jgi:dynamin 1-like protein